MRIKKLPKITSFFILTSGVSTAPPSSGSTGTSPTSGVSAVPLTSGDTENPPSSNGTIIISIDTEAVSVYMSNTETSSVPLNDPTI